MQGGISLRKQISERYKPLIEESGARCDGALAIYIELLSQMEFIERRKLVRQGNCEKR